jgi:diguanylate cyclase (GGDEF)-like protein/PAS domain S-box-containing protein
MIERMKSIRDAVQRELRHADAGSGLVRATASRERLQDARALEEAQQALRVSEARFATLTRLSSEWYWEQDRELRFTGLHGGEIANRWQPTPEQVLGRRRWDITDATPLTCSWDEHRRVLEAQQAFRDFEYARVYPDGGTRYFSVSGEPVFDAEGSFAGYRGTARDITPRKCAEQDLHRSKHLLDEIVDNLPTSVVLKAVDDDFRLVMWNKAAEALYGVPRSEAIGQNAYDMWPVEEAERISAVDRERISAGGFQDDPERLIMTRHRGRIRVHMRKVPLFDAAGRPTYLLVIADDITDRLAAEAKVRESEARFRSLTQLSSDWYWEQDSNYRFVAVARPTQFQSSIQYEGRTRWEAKGADVSEARWAEHRAVLDARLPFHDFEYSRPNLLGENRHVSISGMPMFDDDGVFIGYRGIGKDITDRKRAEQALRQHAMQQSLISSFGQNALANTDLEALFEQAVAAMADGLDVAYCALLQVGDDAQGRASLLLKAGTGWSNGWKGREVAAVDQRTAWGRVLLGREPVIVDDGTNEPSWPLLAAHAIRSTVAVPIHGGTQAYGVLGVCAQEQRHFTAENIDFLQGLANILATAMDRKNAEQRLTYLAQFDTLTGLPNRSLFLDRFAQTLTQAERSDWLVATLFIDLDRFKIVNDTLGHSVGDQLLVQAAQRLRDCVRSGDTVGRLGGDEFAFVLSNIAKVEDAGLVAQKVAASFAQPFILEGQEVYASASIGIAICPVDGTDPDLLLRNADTAMYRAKASGRNGYQFYLPQMNERAAERLRIEGHLRGALERDEFVLHYQPKVCLASGEISGFEALLRWQHPQLGLVHPLDFIPILEDTGLIVPVGEWVVRSVCEQMLHWQSAGVTPRPVAINVSARQFQQADLDTVIARIVTDHGIDPGLIEFELTESMLMNDAEAAVRILKSLKALGVRLSVDDFGTGFSSLAYLKRFPLDALKIDREFIRDITTDPDDAAITMAIISLAHSLKIKVVAEGVENATQLAFLKAQHCDEIQGYLFAQPLTLDDCTRALVEGHRLPDTAAMALSTQER